ncbi:hypothetical protein [Acinetobacter baylyi]|uniref:hypothetical protein n=1 Tax=Acinetobacter baylyi TaxID=202950 RepID=UPI0030D93426
MIDRHTTVQHACGLVSGDFLGIVNIAVGQLSAIFHRTLTHCCFGQLLCFLSTAV